MTILTLRRRRRPAPFVLVERTGHFRLIEGEWKQEVLLRRRADGQLLRRFVAEVAA